MKKILTSVIAAAALLFGFASCSGDLHDVKLISLDGFGMRGTPTGWAEADDVPLTDNGDGTYSVSWTQSEEGTANFAILQCGDGTWNTAYRLAQPKSAGDTANVFSEEGDGKSGQKGMEQKVYLGQSADCMGVPGLKAGDKVSVLITPASTYLTVKVSIEAGTAPALTTPYYFDGLYLVGSCFKIGDMTNLWSFGSANLIYGASVDKKTGNVTYTKDIVAVQAEGEIGINDSSWNNKQNGSGVTIAAEKDYVELDGDAGNFNVSGLKVDSPYRVYIQTTPEKVVSIKIEEICSYTLTFEITGLEEGNAAWINGQFWGSTWPNGWPMAEWDSEPNATLKENIPVAGVDGVATFNEKWNVVSVAKPGEPLSWNFKPVAADSLENFTKEANLVLKPAEDLTCEIASIESGTYKISINAGTEEVTVTKQ